MRQIMTVTGPIGADAMGFTQAHEHLFVRDGPAARLNPALRIDDEGKSLAELRAWRAAGGKTLLDAQPGGAGRDVGALKRLSEGSGVQIIAVTGFHRPMFYLPDSPIQQADEGALYELFLSELTRGVGETGIRAGAVKAALGQAGVCGRDEAMLRAAIRAAARADVPLVLHTEKGAGGADAVRLAEKLGLQPGRVLVCHADRQADDYAPHEAIARTGAFLEYDTVGRFKYHSDEAEIALIRHMLEGGYERQLLFSLDTTAQRLASYGGSLSLTYLIDTFLPALARAGVPTQTLHTIMTDNPARAFAAQPNRDYKE